MAITPVIVRPQIVVSETALDLFSPTDLAKFDMAVRALTALRQQVAALTISDQAQANGAQVLLAELKRAHKTAEETRLAQTRPIRAQESAINATYRPLLDELEDTAKVAERKLLAFNQAERERNAREQEEARRAAAEADAKAAALLAKATLAKTAAAREAAAQQAAAAASDAQAARERETEAETAQNIRGIRTESGTTSSQWPWKFRVLDVALVPREYMVLDESKVRAAIKAGKKGGEVPGLFIYQEESLRTVLR